MKTKKTYIFLLIGLLALTALFESTTAVATRQSNTKTEPIFYISSKGKVVFNKKIGKFGEFTCHKYKHNKYTDWFAYTYSIPTEKTFKFTSKKNISSFTKFLFGKRMKASKVQELDYKLPALGTNQYNINWIDYCELSKEIWVDFDSKDSDFVLIYELDNNFNIKQIRFLTD